MTMYDMRKWKPKKPRKTIKISREEVKKATAEYIKNGGVITNYDVSGNVKNTPNYPRDCEDFLGASEPLYIGNRYY